MAQTTIPAPHDEWLWGWDHTEGIVSIHATLDGRAQVWRRIPSTGALVRETDRFRPWLLLARREDLPDLGVDGLAHRELDGTGVLRHLVSADDGHALTASVLH